MIVYCVDSDDPQGVFDGSGTLVYFSLYRNALADYDERRVRGDHNYIWMTRLVVSKFSMIDLLNRRNFVGEYRIVKKWNAYEDQED